jgi:hypothetical protein
VQQLNNQVNSFLSSATNDFENRLLPNDLIVMGNQRVDHGGCKEHKGRGGELRGHAHQVGVRTQVNFQSNSESKINLHSN